MLNCVTVDGFISRTVMHYTAKKSNNSINRSLTFFFSSTLNNIVDTVCDAKVYIERCYRSNFKMPLEQLLFNVKLKRMRGVPVEFRKEIELKGFTVARIRKKSSNKETETPL